MNLALLMLLRMLLLALALWAVFLLGRFLSFQRDRLDSVVEQSQPTPEEVEAAARAYGRNTNSVVHFYGSLKYYKSWFYLKTRSDEPPPILGYVSLDRENVVITDPLCRPELMKPLLMEFARHTQLEGKDCLVFAIQESTAIMAAQLGFGLVKIGQEPAFDLRAYDPKKHDSKILSAVRQVAKKGVVLEEIPAERIESDPALSRELESITQEWLLTRKGQQLSLLSEVSPFKLLSDKKYFAARSSERIEAYLACSPVFARNGYFIHDMLRRPTAINGISEALTIFALTQLKEQGFEFASLGIASLAGLGSPGVNADHPRLNRVLNWVFEKSTSLVNFKSLYQFKKKFGPSHEEPAFLAIYPPKLKLGHILAIGTLFSPKGILGDLLFKWQRWKSGEQLPRPLRKLANPEIATLARPIPFTLREIVHRCKFTVFMIFLNVYTYMSTTSISGRVLPDVLEQHGFTYSTLISHKWYVLVTSNFVHFNYAHLFGNMVLLAIACGTLEIIGGTGLAALTFLVGMQANIPSGIVILPLLRLLNPSLWNETLVYVDVGASLGVMATLGALFLFFKKGHWPLLASVVIAALVTLFQRTFFGLDHCFALLVGHGVGYLYLAKRKSITYFGGMGGLGSPAQMVSPY